MNDITKERWEFDEETGLLRDGSGRAVECDFTREQAIAVAVLPEALAWMYKMLGQIQDNKIVPDDRDVLHALGILRRAGVLK